MPGLADWVTREAYSDEVSSAGWWPGGNGQQAACYSYTYPSPAGFAEAKVQPDAAEFSQDLGKFVLSYEQARTAANPRQAVLDFLQTTYEAVANLAHWGPPGPGARLAFGSCARLVERKILLFCATMYIHLMYVH